MLSVYTKSKRKLMTRQRTFSADEKRYIDDAVNAFLMQLPESTVCFEISHGAMMAAAASYGLVKKEYTATVVWQEYADEN